MKENLTEIVFILDRSGSMAGLESDTIGGFNGLLEKQKENEGRAIVTTVLFDEKYELLHDRIDIKGIKPINDDDYFVRGCTALLDAVGRTISKIDNVQKNTLKLERAENVLFVIVTDGFENASKEYTYSAVKKLIEEKKKMGWEFMFLGANIDAAEEASKIGIEKARAATYRADSKGIRTNYQVMHRDICEYRDFGAINSSLQEEIDKADEDNR